MRSILVKAAMIAKWARATFNKRGVSYFKRLWEPDAHLKSWERFTCEEWTEMAFSSHFAYFEENINGFK